LTWPQHRWAEATVDRPSSTERGGSAVSTNRLTPFVGARGSGPLGQEIVPGAGPPSGRRAFTDPAVHRFPQQVGVPGVPAVLLDQVADQPAQAEPPPVRPGEVDELVEPTVGQRRP